MRDNSDTELVTAVRDGDRAAFDALYDRYAGRVYAFALQIAGGNRAEAEDLVQEAFVAAFRGIGGFRGSASLLTWLLAIALRRWRDKCRRPLLKSVAVEVADRHPPSAPLFDTQSVDAIRLRTALSELSHPLQEAFLLVTVQEQSYREAGQALRCSASTVRWRVQEAHRRLRTLLDTDEEPILRSAPIAPTRTTGTENHEHRNAVEPTA